MDGSNIQKCVGTRVKRLREKNKMLQKTVADALCVSVSSYAKLEAGDRGISSENCIALADLFGVSCDYILRGVEFENIDIWKETGLANRSISLLKAHKRFNLDSIMEVPAFWRIIERIDCMTDYANDPVHAERRWDINSYIAHKQLDRLLNELRNEAIDRLSYDDRNTIEVLRDIRENGDEYEFEAEADWLELVEENDL